MRRTILLAAAVAALPAAAQLDPPRIRPAHDVVVTYAVDGQAARLVPGGLPGPVRLFWDAAGQRLRAEADGHRQVALVDLRAHTGQAIDTGLRIVLPLPLRAADLQPLTLEGGRLVPLGKLVVAGLPCTVYRVENGRAPSTICLTTDGVPLRGEGEIQGKPGRFTATNVRYGPLPTTLFTVPPGYIALGSGNGGAGLSGLAGALGGMGDLRSLGSSLLGRPK